LIDWMQKCARSSRARPGPPASASDPPPAHVERDGRAVRVGSAERHGVGGPVEQRQPPVRVGCPVVGRQPPAADAHPHRQRAVGRDVVQVDPYVRDAFVAADVADPRRTRVDEVAEPTPDHVGGRELRCRGDHRVRAEHDRGPGRLPDVHRVPHGRALGDAAHDRLRVPVPAPRQREPVGRHGERTGSRDRRVVDAA